jgi:putative CocE/NonD family hydrolase
LPPNFTSHSVKYISPPITENLEVVGPAALNLFASLDQDDTTWIVKLYDITPTGAETRLTKGYLRASHRALDPAKSKPYSPYQTHTKEEPVKPGEICEYNIGLGVVTNVFKPGHRIKLEIESLESARDPEMQIHYHPHLCNGKTTVHKIYRNKQYQSHLVLPLVSGKQSALEMLSDDNLI